MRSSLITNYARVFTSAPVNYLARKVTQPGRHYDRHDPADAPPQQPVPAVSASDVLLFRRLFGKQWRNHGNRIVIRRAS